MLATQTTPATYSPLSLNVRQPRRKATPPAITSDEVKNILLEITFNLHTTRVVKKLPPKARAK